MKNNGVVLAVLETPYVRLDKDPAVTTQNPAYFPQDPKEGLYEYFVRSTIYPGGPNASGANNGSVVSAALSSCASSGYYFSATSPTDIATGFVTLTDKFLATVDRLSQ